MSRRRDRTGRIQRTRYEEPQRSGLGALPRRVLVGIAAALAVIVLIAVGFVAGLGEQSELQARVRQIAVASRNHVQGSVPYPEAPPAGGDHAPVWQNCGYYPQPIVPEMGVHTLEHGAVWVTYGPDLSAEQVDRLRQLATSQTFVLISPFDGLPAPIVATAWGRQLDLESADDSALNAFIREFRQGSTTPEPGAPCTGGSGTPQ